MIYGKEKFIKFGTELAQESTVVEIWNVIFIILYSIHLLIKFGVFFLHAKY